MALPRAVAGGVVAGHARDNDNLPQENTIERSLGVAVPPVKKRRQRGTVASKKQRVGEQNGLCQLNIDELYIIFAYVYPMDLLNLARTCKSLRGLLMHQSSLFLWRIALHQVRDLPECPPDLDEPAYINLVFYNRCHGCGKPARSVLWNIRRRYCSTCRAERLCRDDSCDIIIHRGGVLPTDRLCIENVFASWIDRDQVDSFMREYHQALDKTRFLDEKRKQCEIIKEHANRCAFWREVRGRVCRFDLNELRKEQQESIFKRLRHHGYEPELKYFQDGYIAKSYKHIFKEYKYLTNDEWDRVWPALVEVMDDLRSQRMEEVLWRPRRHSLMVEYLRYVVDPDTQTFDLLPHPEDLAALPPFRNIILAPEEAVLEDKPFAAAFALLPIYAAEWMQQLNSEMAGLIKIPPCLSPDSNSKGGDKVSDGAKHDELSQRDLDKLHLACAMFHAGGGTGVLAYPEVLSVAMCHSTMFPRSGDRPDSPLSIPQLMMNKSWGCTGPVDERLGLQFLEEAPYIIHACGMDPNVATADDMNRRNARLRCLSCEGQSLVMNWRHAIWHARMYHCVTIGLGPLSGLPRWQLVGDEHIDIIQAVEQCVQGMFPPEWTQCMLCRPHLGDALLYKDVACHLTQWHAMEASDIKEGVHYKVIGVRDNCAVVMIGAGDQVAFGALFE